MSKQTIKKKKTITKKTRQTKTYWEFVNNVLSELQRELYMHKWSFILLKSRDPKEKCNCGETALAEISILPRYFKATITCYPILEDLYNKGQHDAVARTLVHEMCHVLTEPLYDLAWDGVAQIAKDHLEYVREQSTQHLAVILYDLLSPRIFSIYKDKKK